MKKFGADTKDVLITFYGMVKLFPNDDIEELWGKAGGWICQHDNIEEVDGYAFCMDCETELGVLSYNE